MSSSAASATRCVVAAAALAVDLEQDRLGVEVVDPHQPERRAEHHRRDAVLVDGEGVLLRTARARRRARRARPGRCRDRVRWRRASRRSSTSPRRCAAAISASLRPIRTVIVRVSSLSLRRRRRGRPDGSGRGRAATAPRCPASSATPSPVAARWVTVRTNSARLARSRTTPCLHRRLQPVGEGERADREHRVAELEESSGSPKCCRRCVGVHYVGRCHRTRANAASSRRRRTVGGPRAARGRR